MNRKILLALISLECLSYFVVNSMNWARKVDKFPDMAFVMSPTAVLDLGSVDKFCFGALLSLKWVVTLAQCVSKKCVFKTFRNYIGITIFVNRHPVTYQLMKYQPVRVKLGYQVNRNDKPKFNIEVNKKHIHIHPEYNFTLENDVALLRISAEKVTKIDGN